MPVFDPLRLARARGNVTFAGRMSNVRNCLPAALHNAYIGSVFILARPLALWVRRSPARR